MRLPVMISGTITDLSGRTLSGQTPKPSGIRCAMPDPFTIGLNCALGAEDARASRRIVRVADTFVCAYPNAGLPNEFGQYDESPEFMAAQIEEFAAKASSMSSAAAAARRRSISAPSPRPSRRTSRRASAGDQAAPALSGLEPFTLTDDDSLRQCRRAHQRHRLGQVPQADHRRRLCRRARCGARPGREWRADHRHQHGRGPARFRRSDGRVLNLIAAEPDIARVSGHGRQSKFNVIEAGLKCVQGKPIVNSISMKEGEEKFIHHAKICRAYGAAVVVMAFDEKGQADTKARKTEICTRAYKLLTEQAGFPPEDIIFDPQHLRHRDRHRGAQQLRRRLHRGDALIRETLPHAHISGGVSNLSFSFRGNEPVREAMHSVFLYHAIKAAWTWASSMPASSRL
jgi:5-methyltetrahydrofolate--homocysteine methyltransferase